MEPNKKIKFTQDHNHDNVQYKSGEVAELPASQVDSIIELGFGVEASEADEKAWQEKKTEQSDQAKEEQPAEEPAPEAAPEQKPEE